MIVRVSLTMSGALLLARQRAGADAGRQQEGAGGAERADHPAGAAQHRQRSTREDELAPTVEAPPPTGTTQRSSGPAASTSSSATVPWPATISGSSKGWTKVSPRSSRSRSLSASASPVVSPYSTTSAP